MFIAISSRNFFVLWQELLEIKRKNVALQMQHFVGEEKNDLLDYLRSLQPEKVSISPFVTRAFVSLFATISFFLVYDDYFVYIIIFKFVIIQLNTCRGKSIMVSIVSLPTV